MLYGKLDILKKNALRSPTHQLVAKVIGSGKRTNIIKYCYGGLKYVKMWIASSVSILQDTWGQKVLKEMQIRFK